MSTSTFTATPLTNHTVLVTGRDISNYAQEVVLDSTEFDMLLELDDQNTAVEDFDLAVKEFFAPIEEAAEQLNKPSPIDTDPMLYYVEQEEVEGVEAKRAIVHVLSKDTVVLRMIAEGETDRLIWANNTIHIAKV